MIEPLSESRTIDEMLAWRNGVNESLSRDRAFVLRSIVVGADAGDRFLGMTESDVKADFETLRLETDRFVVLGLVAAGEAEIRRDYEHRVGRDGKKRRDALSRAYREFKTFLKPHQRDRPPFDEGGLLDELKAAKVIDNQIVGRFRECLPARHWVAHGRDGQRPEAIDKYPPEIVYSRVDELIKALAAA